MVAMETRPRMIQVTEAEPPTVNGVTVGFSAAILSLSLLCWTDLTFGPRGRGQWTHVVLHGDVLSGTARLCLGNAGLDDHLPEKLGILLPVRQTTNMPVKKSSLGRVLREDTWWSPGAHLMWGPAAEAPRAPPEVSGHREPRLTAASSRRASMRSGPGADS